MSDRKGKRENLFQVFQSQMYGTGSLAESHVALAARKNTAPLVIYDDYPELAGQGAVVWLTL